MDDILTIDEIESRFPDEWIFVIVPELGSDMRVRSGVVAAHDRSRQVVYQKAIARKPKRSAISFNGNPFPPGAVVIVTPFYGKVKSKD